MKGSKSAANAPGRGLHSRSALLAIGATVLVAVAGCTSNSAAVSGASISGSSSSSLASAQPAVSSTPPIVSPTTTPQSAAGTARSGTAAASTSPSRVTLTVIKTRPGQTITVGPPTATAEPAATAGDCPYLTADVVTFITGQHHGQTQLVKLSPQPMCVFYRSDGGWMGTIRVIEAANPLAAVAAVNQHVPIAGSQPASQPAGWSGGLMSTPGQMSQGSDAKSVYAVSKGSIAIVVEENESPSIKARSMAVCAIYGLKLEAGQAPAACSGAEG